MFQTSPNTQTQEKPKESFYSKFASQPHQPFFFSGLSLLTIFMIILFLSYSQIITLAVPLSIFHGYALVFVVFVQFFLGFLFVVFPRFLMQAEIEQSVYMNQFKLYFAGSILFIVSVFISIPMTIISSLILLCAQVWSFNILYAIHQKSLMKEKNDTKWVLIAFCTGLISHAFFIISMFEFSWASIIQNSSLYAGFYLFLFTLIFAIAQRMVPFFTSAKVQGYVINKSKYLMETVFVLLILKVVLLTLQMPQYNFLADLPLLVVFTKELFKWKLPLTKTIPIMWVLYVSIYWIPVGFLLSSIESVLTLLNTGIVFEKSVLHTFAIGYFITILLGFGTRVVLGHSGRTPTADTITTWMFVLVQAVVVLRVFAGFSINFNLDYVFWINVSAVALFVLLTAWAIKYVPILIKLK